MVNEYKCKHCEKIYSSIASRSNHIRIKHKTDGDHLVASGDPIVLTKYTQENCSICNKIFANRHSRWRHEKKCKIEKENKENEKKENENKEIVEMKKQIKALEELIKNKENKTVNNNNGTIINNNIHINALGRENIINQLTLQEQINIATCHLFNESPHVEMVRLTYTKENCIENQNTFITNLQIKSCQVYNNKTGKFEATNKSQHIDNIIHYRKKDVQELSETLKNNKKVYKKYGNKLDPVEPIDPAKDKEEITYIIYNNRDKVKEIKKQVDNGDIKEDLEDEEIEDDVEESPVQNIVV
jgi:hypothetical protein